VGTIDDPDPDMRQAATEETIAALRAVPTAGGRTITIRSEEFVRVGSTLIAAVNDTGRFFAAFVEARGCRDGECTAVPSSTDRRELSGGMIVSIRFTLSDVEYEAMRGRNIGSPEFLGSLKASLGVEDVSSVQSAGGTVAVEVTVDSADDLQALETALVAMLGEDAVRSSATVAPSTGAPSATFEFRTGIEDLEGPPLSFAPTPSATANGTASSEDLPVTAIVAGSVSAVLLAVASLCYYRKRRAGTEGYDPVGVFSSANAY